MEKCTKPGCTLDRAPYVGTGRPTVYCAEHQPKKARKERSDAARAEKQQQSPAPVKEPKHREVHELEHAAAREAHRRSAGKAIEHSLRAFRPQMLAVYLDAHTPVERAAELAGVDYESKEELEEIAAAAVNYRGLSEGKPEALGGVITRALAIGAIRLAATIPATQPAQLMNGLYRLAETLELVQGKAQSVFTELAMVFELEGGDRWDPNELLPKELRARGRPPHGSTISPTPQAARATTPSAPGSSDPTNGS